MRGSARKKDFFFGPPEANKLEPEDATVVLEKIGFDRAENEPTVLSATKESGVLYNSYSLCREVYGFGTSCATETAELTRQMPRCNMFRTFCRVSAARFGAKEIRKREDERRNKGEL